MLFRLLSLILLTGSLFVGTARADDYATPSWPGLMRTMVRFNAISLSDPTLLDEYTIITECDLYKAFYHNDFKWKQVRDAVMQSVKNNIATFPMTYRYDRNLQLDRYDFTAKLFRFTDKSRLANVNSFEIYAVTGTGCGLADVKMVPRNFHAVISVPVYMEGIPLNEADAKALLQQMDRDGNVNRVVTARFNMRIVYVDPMRRITEGVGSGQTTKYKQSNAIDNVSIRLDARLDTIDFYEDEAMTRKIYTLQL